MARAVQSKSRAERTTADQSNDDSPNHRTTPTSYPALSLLVADDGQSQQSKSREPVTNAPMLRKIPMRVYDVGAPRLEFNE